MRVPDVLGLSLLSSRKGSLLDGCDVLKFSMKAKGCWPHRKALTSVGREAEST